MGSYIDERRVQGRLLDATVSLLFHEGNLWNTCLGLLYLGTSNSLVWSETG